MRLTVPSASPTSASFFVSRGSVCSAQGSPTTRSTTYLPCEERRERTSIASFYATRTVLITGATGFVGRALLSRLLRLDPENPLLPKIFLLIRGKRGDSAQKRLTDLIAEIDPVLTKLLASPVGDAIRRRLVVIEGDVEAEGLGLSKADFKRIRAEVSIVFHCAANVTFRKEMKPFFMANVMGLTRTVGLAEQCRHLQAFIYVSTAFCNAERGAVEETVYRGLDDPLSLMELFSKMDDRLLESSRPQLLGKKLNSYTWSKALAEHYLSTLPVSFPVAIVRPSVISSSISDPVPGWIHGMQGVVGPSIAIGTGVLQVAPFDYSGISDIIPIDKVINSLLVVAWWRSNDGKVAPAILKQPSRPFLFSIRSRPSSTLSIHSAPAESTHFSLSPPPSLASLTRVSSETARTLVNDGASISSSQSSKAYSTALKRVEGKPTTPVFHITTSASPKRLPTGDLLRNVVKHTRPVKFQQRFRRPSFDPKFGWQLSLKRAFKHQLVAYAVDGFSRSGKMHRIYNKVDFLVEELQPVAALKSVFLDQSMRELDQLVQHTADGAQFSTAMDWEWDPYFAQMMRGIKEFVLDPQERKNKER